ncbi:MAG: type II toxin-antitoxin system PemK/MazF family toxin [Planctomycetes bacterium]|nr:type II toxin-antitoxin system PemK/MazF family toxin [Planctomycetota bacterium]
MNRGDVVLADLPYSDWSGSKIRPAVIVSTDHNNLALDDVILAAISRQTRAASISHVLLDPGTPEGKQTGVLHVCYVQCENLFTLDKGRILHTIRSLSQALTQHLDTCLKASLGLP